MFPCESLCLFTQYTAACWRLQHIGLKLVLFMLGRVWLMCSHWSETARRNLCLSVCTCPGSQKTWVHHNVYVKLYRDWAKSLQSTKLKEKADSWKSLWERHCGICVCYDLLHHLICTNIFFLFPLTGNRSKVLPGSAGSPPCLTHIPVFAGVYQETPGPAQSVPWQGGTKHRRSGRPSGAQVAHSAWR